MSAGRRITACILAVLLCPVVVYATVSGSRPSWCAVEGPKQVAMSVDGRLLLVATSSPPLVRVFDTELKLVRAYPVVTLDGKMNSAVHAVHDATARHSWVIVLRDLAEVWEISYDSAAEPIYDGLVHDYRMGEALAKSGYLGIRRTILDKPLRDIFFDESYRHVVGLSRTDVNGKLHANVINLDIRRSIATVELPDMAGAVEAGFTVRWNSGSVKTVHSPDTSHRKNSDVLRRYCAP